MIAGGVKEASNRKKRAGKYQNQEHISDAASAATTRYVEEADQLRGFQLGGAVFLQ